MFTVAGVVYATLPAADIGNPDSFRVNILKETFGYRQGDVDVDLEKIFQGCRYRDCIRSVDQPRFGPVEAVDYLADGDLVLAVSLNGVERAYPVRFLERHEIVNDMIGPVPVAITYCPLCGSGLAFRRDPGGEVVQFGVSGLLHNNDLIMYDRATGSLWQQITGTAIGGPRRGMKLETLPVTMAEWGDWSESHPDAVVLKPPGPMPMYAGKAYGSYDQSDRLMFPVDLQDARLHRKKMVYGLRLGAQALAVDEEWLRGQGGFSRQLEDGMLRLELADDGGIDASLDGRPLAAHRMYWFAWYSFNPDTALIGGKAN